MSAFICSDRHIATIAVNYCKLTKTEDAQAIADKLKEINIAAVNWRYPNHPPEPVTPCSLSAAVDNLTFPDLFALCECLDYNSVIAGIPAITLLDEIAAKFKAKYTHGIKSAMWSI